MAGLPLSERDGRWARVRAEMASRGIDCLIVYGNTGRYRHLTGNLSWLCGTTSEGYLVFPRDGDPTLIAFVGLANFFYQVDHGETPWVEDFRTGHPEYSRVIADRVGELKLGRGRIAIAGLSGYDAEVGFPHVTYTRLSAHLSGTELVDAGGLLEDLRLTKSPLEIECLEKGAAIANKAINLIGGLARPGITDLEIRAAVLDRIYREGCEPGAMLLLHTGKHSIHGGSGGLLPTPLARVLHAGDIINTEFDACYLGYKAQVNQPFLLGQPDESWRSIFDAVEESFRIGVNFLKPGVCLGELEQAMMEPVKSRGFVNGSPPFHGIGLSLEQPMGHMPLQPNYVPDPGFVIRENMVIELEPPAVRPDFARGTTLGNMVVVTNDGCRLLCGQWRPEAIILET